ncbi:DUF456 domain-containing protein [Ekhidna sp. To15]|uniref:DUF456 domain-containing protein n=1 Tax=Ekhidna sp. To15 TaxID=3395267 RepID=UPI003F51C55B
MEALLIILSVLLIAGGIIFSILPPLPGPVLSFGAMICTNAIANDTEFSTSSFIVWGVIGILITVADYVLPVAATKKFGGTKAGVIGGMIGMVAGVLLPIPFGIILGPLLGAIVGDLYGGNRIRSAFKSGFGSFLGFLLATSLKLLYSIILGGIIAWKVGGFTANAIIEMF